ncbi:unnamed protein product [Allacma fusca]|uniref:Uncharacterized protein n=1 Tax=Allacma fusca TaxID=39272 RepID=A0A8J2PR43_9HEXA|nr:unnamed protein product [Allacma fusca]
MNLFLLTLSILSALSSVIGAPAVSSVHVSFVSGNKATEYSHGSTGDGNLVQYKLVDKLEGVGEHSVKKRSLTRGPPRDPGGTRKIRGRTTLPTTTTYEPSTTTILTPTIPTLVNTDITTGNDGTIVPTTASFAIGNRKPKRKRVRFIMGQSTSNPRLILAESSSDKPLVVMTGVKIDSELQVTNSDNIKPKDSKAVKRSPYVGSSFVGSFNFPDFDEFGGNEFGSLGNFGGSGSSGAGNHRTSYSAHNPEALAPEGVFHPPIPTEASQYSENDPYLADPDTAKYASQHPPFFSEFPHKRTVLALNERREENGLEPNLLRSIRPFFPFFEVSNSL